MNSLLICGFLIFSSKNYANPKYSWNRAKTPKNAGYPSSLQY